jgi:hypothetical protein
VVILCSTSSIRALASILATIPPVLDGIVAPAIETACNFGPAFPEVRDKSFDHETFLGCDGFVVECWF